jgi:hypothetical protein
LNDPNRLAAMTDEEVIALNVRALEEAGVERSQIEMIRREAMQYAAEVRARASLPRPNTSSQAGETSTAAPPEAVAPDTAGPVVETSVPPEGAADVVPPEGAPPEGATGEGPGGGAAVAGVGIGLAYSLLIHPAAIARRRDTEGFAPTGPDPEEGILTRLGRFFLDPTFDDAVPAASRFNLPVWRSRVRSAAGAKRSGETLRMSWERERPGLFPGSVTHDNVDVEYTRQPDGTFSAGRVVDGDAEGFTPPDINRVLDPNVSNDSVMYMLSDHSDEA